MTDFAYIEGHIRDRTRDIAKVMRDYADKVESLALEKDITGIPAAVTQTLTNMQFNLRADIPTVWLGELLKAERAVAEHERGSSGADE